MRPFWVIVFLLVVVSRIVSMMIERANKKKQQEQRMRPTGARRQHPQGTPQAQPAAQQQAQQRRPAGQGRGLDPAARRKAQLDELRRRRQGRATVGPATAPPPRPTPPARQAPIVTRAPSRPAAQGQVRPTPFPVRRDQPPGKSRPAAAIARQAAPPAAAVPAAPHRAAQPAFAAAATASQRQADGAYKLGAGHRPTPGFQVGKAILGLEGGPSALRRMVILKEILDRPLALRE